MIGTANTYSSVNSRNTKHFCHTFTIWKILRLRTLEYLWTCWLFELYSQIPHINNLILVADNYLLLIAQEQLWAIGRSSNWSVFNVVLVIDAHLTLIFSIDESYKDESNVWQTKISAWYNWLVLKLLGRIRSQCWWTFCLRYFSFKVLSFECSLTWCIIWTFEFKRHWCIQLKENARVWRDIL